MKILRLIITICLGGVILVGCSSNPDSSDDQKNKEAHSSQDHHAASDKKSADKKSHKAAHEDKKASHHDSDSGKQNGNKKSGGHSNDKQKGHHNGNKGSKTKDKTNKENNNNQTAAKDQLKMRDSNIKQPTDFPVSGNVKAHISKNKSSTYAINYNTPPDKKVVSFKGTLYKSADKANSELDEFMNGKAVPKNNDTKKNLGHGIKGYSEGTAGHVHFGWEEGNWTLAIKSVSADEMDNAGIAKKVVDYLESHSLPVPKDEGMVFVNYPKGGNSVDVDIRWQEHKMVYQLKTKKVPLKALKMATSVK